LRWKRAGPQGDGPDQVGPMGSSWIQVPVRQSKRPMQARLYRFPGDMEPLCHFESDHGAHVA